MTLSSLILILVHWIELNTVFNSDDQKQIPFEDSFGFFFSFDDYNFVLNSDDDDDKHKNHVKIKMY